MSKEHSSQHLDEEALPHSLEHDEELLSGDLEIELDDTLLDDSQLDSSDIDVSELDEYTKDEEPELDANDNSNLDSRHDLYNLTLFELEHKLLITFTKLCDILEQLASSSVASGSNHTTNTLKSPTPNELFATAIHMAKSKNKAF